MRRVATALRPERLFMVVAALAAFSASACLFLFELVAGKALLPRFGGAPGVWTSCLAFFQLTLVAAYFHADRLIKTLSPRTQLVVQATVFIVAWAVTFVGLGASVTAQVSDALPRPLMVMVFLAGGVGPVFFTVATLAPLIAHWRTLMGDGRDAHWLYAAGNAGSFAVLLAYPLAIEPTAGLAWQMSLAGRCYIAVGLLTLMAGGLAATAWRSSPASGAPGALQPVAAALGWGQWLRWCVVAALPASWLSSVTTHATVEIAPMPLLWVVPLAVYLASFVIVFAPHGRALRRWEPLALCIAVGTTAWMLAGNVSEPAWPAVIGHLLAFFVVCVCLHGMLVDSRPDPSHLSSLYLAMAVGGACGGLFNALVAPAIFDAHHEFPLVVAATAALGPALLPSPRSLRRGLALVAAIVLGGLILGVPWLMSSRPAWLALLAATVGGSLIFLPGAERTLAFGLVLATTFFLDEKVHCVSHRTRTFFGVLRVCDDGNGPSRRLMHGGISHGVQLVSDDRDRRSTALSYYHPAGPLGSIFRGMEADQPPRRVGVAGLGVGTIASYAQPGQEFVFFEIDPAIVRIARDETLFTFLADCRGNVQLVVDDARLALEREADGAVDLLVIDAFTGDAVPTHLLTREAFALYGRVVGADGVLALHVSNKFIDFVPVVEALAADGGWMALRGRDDDVPPEYARSPSEWMALSRSLDTIKAIYANPTSDRWQWTPAARQPKDTPWTDDRAAVAEALRR